jgi:hypothetical protein
MEYKTIHIQLQAEDKEQLDQAALRADATVEENKTNKVFGNDTMPAAKALTLAAYLEGKKESGVYALAKKA